MYPTCEAQQIMRVEIVKEGTAYLLNNNFTLSNSQKQGEGLDSNENDLGIGR
ncbi:MAG: hypothetical protein WBQ32_00180 [Ignavibacteriaceae bacterium]